MSASSDRESSGEFETTQWSLVVAGGQRDSPQAQQALGLLCGRYWPPLYSFVRRAGFSMHDAQDLTQQFFLKLLDKDYLQDADPERGRFRSFLLAALRHFLANERKAARAVKRGGGRQPIPWDFSSEESTYLAEPADEVTPAMLFDRRWALLLLDSVLNRLATELATAGKAEQFQHLKGFLIAEGDAQPYQRTAEALGTNEAAVKMAVHRLRRRYRELLREEIARTVADPRDVDDELRQLFGILAAKKT